MSERSRLKCLSLSVYSTGYVVWQRHIRIKPTSCKRSNWSCMTNNSSVVTFLLNSLQWRHNERDGVSIHRPHDYLLNRLFKRRLKKTSKLRSLAFVRGIHRWPVNSPHKGSVTWKMFLFDDVIMLIKCRCQPAQSVVCLHNSEPRFSWNYVFVLDASPTNCFSEN